MPKAPKMTPKVPQLLHLFFIFLGLGSISTRNVPLDLTITQKASSGHQYWLKVWPPGLKISPKVTSRSQARTRRFKPHCSGPLDLIHSGMPNLFLSDPILGWVATVPGRFHNSDRAPRTRSSPRRPKVAQVAPSGTTLASLTSRLVKCT